MEFSLDEIMALSQQGTVKEYCDEFQFLYDQVRTFGEICEYYAIYLFMDGLEPEIRDVFIAWHQYSFHTLKDVISLALKLDANELKDSFSPYDPNSSLYDAFKVFGVNDSLEIGRVTDNDVLRENENDNKTASKVFDEMPSTFGTESGSLNLDLSIRVFDEMSKKSGNEIKEPLGDEIQELIEINAFDVKKGDVSELKKGIKEYINGMSWNVMFEGLDNDSKKIGKGNLVYIDFCKDVHGIGTLFQHVWGEFEQGTVVKVVDEDSGVMEEHPRHSFEKDKDVVTTWIKNTETGQLGIDSVVLITFVWKPGLTFSVENCWEAYINSNEYTTSGKLRDKVAEIIVTTEMNSTKEFVSLKKKKESSWTVTDWSIKNLVQNYTVINVQNDLDVPMFVQHTNTYLNKVILLTNYVSFFGGQFHIEEVQTKGYSGNKNYRFALKAGTKDTEVVDSVYHLVLLQEFFDIEKVVLKNKLIVRCWHKWKSKLRFLTMVMNECYLNRKPRRYMWHKWEFKWLFLIVTMDSRLFIITGKMSKHVSCLMHLQRSSSHWLLNRNLLKTFLVLDANHQIEKDSIEASDSGEAAIEKPKPPDACFMNLQMAINGFEGKRKICRLARMVNERVKIGEAHEINDSLRFSQFGFDSFD